MKYLKKYHDFGIINEAVDVNKLQISVQFSGYKADEKYKKGIVGACSFIYDGKALNAAPINFTFLDSEDRFVYSTTEAINISQGNTIAGPFKMGILKKSIAADGKAVIANFGAEPTTWALNLNKKGTAWMGQANLNVGGGAAFAGELTIQNGFEMDSPELTEAAKKEITEKLSTIKGKVGGLTFKAGASQDGDVNQKIKNANTVKYLGDKEVTRQEWDLKLVELRYATLKAFIESLGFKAFSVGHPANDKNVYGRFDKADLKNPVNRSLVISTKALD